MFSGVDGGRSLPSDSEGKRSTCYYHCYCRLSPGAMPLSLFSKMGNSRSAPSTPVIATRDGKIQGKRLVDEPNFKADAYLVSCFVSTVNVNFEWYWESSVISVGRMSTWAQMSNSPNHHSLQGIPFAQPPLGDLRFRVRFFTKKIKIQQSLKIKDH